MSNTRTRERPPMANPFGMGGEIAPVEGDAAALPTLMPAAGAGRATDNALAGVITAQRVAVKRNLGDILTEARALGGQAGQDFYYSIPYKSKDKTTGEFNTVYVEGPSIKAAMACASIYGNCRVGAQVTRETHSHWFFQAVFQDLEKGTTVLREFQAQKPQEGRGRMDTARRADMDFQSAQSKAIRNVVVAAIPLVVDAAYQAARDSLLQRVEKMGKAEATNRALTMIERLGIPIKRVERRMGMPHDDWGPKQIVRVIMDAKAVADGMLSAEEAWPSLASDEQTAEQQAETVVQEAAAAEAHLQDDGSAEEEGSPSAEGAEGSGSAEAEGGGGGSNADPDDATERRDDPPPPATPALRQQQAAAPKPPPAQQQQRQAKPRADPTPPPAQGGGLSFD